MITETWLNVDQFDFYTIREFTSYYSYLGGRTAVYIKNSLNCELLNTFDNKHNSIWLKVSSPLNCSKCFTISNYCRPNWVNLNSLYTKKNHFS